MKKEKKMKEVKIEPTLLNQSNSAYTNPTFTVVKVKVPKFQFAPASDVNSKSSNQQTLKSN